jgi:hypothetical protein
MRAASSPPPRAEDAQRMRVQRRIVAAEALSLRLRESSAQRKSGAEQAVRVSHLPALSMLYSHAPPAQHAVLELPRLRLRARVW